MKNVRGSEYFPYPLYIHAYVCVCVCVYIYIYIYIYIIYSAHMHIFFKRLTALLLLFKTVVQVGSRGLVDRALDLKPFNPRLWVRIPAPSTTAPRALHSRRACALGWVKCREHISLLIILYIIVYVTNKAHLSLICICLFVGVVSKQKEIYRYQPK